MLFKKYNVNDCILIYCIIIHCRNRCMALNSKRNSSHGTLYKAPLVTVRTVSSITFLQQIQ